MKTDLSYLPQHKQNELAHITKLIKEFIPVEMVILFGSYARNDWVEDKYNDTQFRYQSDMDILVVVETRSESKQKKYQLDIKRKIREDEFLKTPVSIIVHDIEFFNRRLRRAQYFFADIKQDGIFLCHSGRHELQEAKKLMPQERKALAMEDFKYFFKEADGFMNFVKFGVTQGELNKAAFLLHQVTERLYTSIFIDIYPLQT